MPWDTTKFASGECRHKPTALNPYQKLPTKATTRTSKMIERGKNPPSDRLPKAEAAAGNTQKKARSAAAIKRAAKGWSASVVLLAWSGGSRGGREGGTDERAGLRVG